MVSNHLCPFPKRLVFPKSSRVQGLQLSLARITYVFINCYLPVDHQSPNMNLTEILHCLQDIKYVLDLCHDDSKFIVLGDLNTSFNRQTVFVNLVEGYLNDN